MTAKNCCCPVTHITYWEALTHIWTPILCSVKANMPWSRQDARQDANKKKKMVRDNGLEQPVHKSYQFFHFCFHAYRPCKTNLTFWLYSQSQMWNRQKLVSLIPWNRMTDTGVNNTVIDMHIVSTVRMSACVLPFYLRHAKLKTHCNRSIQLWGVSVILWQVHR